MGCPAYHHPHRARWRGRRFHGPRVVARRDLAGSGNVAAVRAGRGGARHRRGDHADQPHPPRDPRPHAGARPGRPPGGDRQAVSPACAGRQGRRGGRADRRIQRDAERDRAARRRAGATSRSSRIGSRGAHRRTARRQGAGRGCEPRQEPLPCEHEPRDPHADERHPGHVGSAPRHPAGRAPGPFRGHAARFGRTAAVHHQRHPRLFQDRGWQARARAASFLAGAGGRRSGAAVCRARPAQGSRAAGAGGPVGAVVGARRPASLQAGARQPGVERGQVHRGGGSGGAARTADAGGAVRRRGRSPALHGRRHRHRHSRKRPEESLQGLLPGRQFDGAALWRHRAWPRDRPATGRDDGRRAELLQRARPRRQLQRRDRGRSACGPGTADRPARRRSGGGDQRECAAARGALRTGEQPWSAVFRISDGGTVSRRLGQARMGVSGFAAGPARRRAGHSAAVRERGPGGGADAAALVLGLRPCAPCRRPRMSAQTPAAGRPRPPVGGPAQRAARRAEGAQRAEPAFQRTRAAGRRPSGQPRDRGGDVALAGMYGGDRRQRHCRGQDLYQRQLRRGPDGYPDA